MNTETKEVVVILGILIAAGLIWMAMYNSIVSKDATVEGSWGNVQTAYQRRADLIPALVETVKGAADFEHDTLVELTELRTQATSLSSDLSDPTVPRTFKAKILEMEAVAQKTLVIVESYPEIKSNANFLALQDELAGTENRIKYARDEYNGAVKSYKVATKSYPGALVARVHGFDSEKYEMFSAQFGAEDAIIMDDVFA